MTDTLTALAPERLFRHFERFTQIPRPSGREEAIVDHVLQWAAEHGFETRRDETGNVVVRVPATEGHEKAPVVVIQGHLDMVCERNRDSEVDPETEPLRVVLDGEWVTAEGTTLGADNAVGVCAGMAAAEDPDVVHGPLELLMTVDEEVGMSGAMGLDASMLEGRILLNLDSEEDGKLFVGCAGGCDTNLELDLEREPAPATAQRVDLVLSGVRGGHSGLDIHRNRVNAIHALAQVVDRVLEAGLGRLATFEGGSKRNAIPREAQATLAVEGARIDELRERVETERKLLVARFAGIDDELRISVEPATDDDSPEVWTDASARRAVSLLRALPSGVVAMSQDIEGLVETSTNLGVVRTEGDRLHTLSCSRSSVAPAMDAILDRIDAIARLAGARSERRGAYPGWKPDLDSKALAVVRAAAEDLTGTAPEVCAIHAGLECGLLGEKVPGMDMISFGPEIQGAHSPDERLHVESTQRFWDLFVRVLADLAR